MYTFQKSEGPYLLIVACALYHVHIHIVHKVSHLRHVLNNMYLVRRSFSILREGKKSRHAAIKAKQPLFNYIRKQKPQEIK